MPRAWRCSQNRLLEHLLPPILGCESSIRSVKTSEGHFQRRTSVNCDHVPGSPQSIPSNHLGGPMSSTKLHFVQHRTASRCFLRYSERVFHLEVPRMRISTILHSDARPKGPWRFELFPGPLCDENGKRWVSSRHPHSEHGQIFCGQRGSSSLHDTPGIPLG